MEFKLQATVGGSNARAGEITTDHGKILTPIFMPVGTLGSVKGVHQHELRDDIKAQIILGNTYHLYLRPGTEIIRKAGGLHKFNGWEKPILTDSGGFQVFSLSDRRKLTEEGAHFRSHIDGSKHLFTPEGVVDIERIIGADIMMALDECPPGMADYSYARKSLDLTHRWLQRGWKRYKETEGLYGYSQAYFPIVQGVRYPDLRRESAKFVSDFGADGNAIGGLAVGEPTLLDCPMPTRNGRNGMLFTANGVMNMRNKKWADDFSPIDENGPSYVDRVYSRAYLRHLFISQELLAMQIASIHNLAFYLWLVGEARRHILEGGFPAWKADMVVRVTQRL